jgi:hypothetical protein
MQIENYGVTKSYIQKNNKKSLNELKWKGKYDGNKAHIELLLNEDGKKEYMQMKLTNKELMELLNVQPIETPLDQKLLMDFMPMRSTTKRRKSKTRKSKTRKIKK